MALVTIDSLITLPLQRDLYEGRLTCWR